MSKYNFQGTNISANSIHIGDSYVYHSPSEFFEKNNLNSFSETEKKLVDIIFENTSSEEERQSILKSLETIREENSKIEEKKYSFLNFKPLIKTLKTTGERVALGLLTIFLKEKADSLDPNFLKDLF